MFEILQHRSVNVEFHLMLEGGATAAKEGAVSTEDKVPIARQEMIVKHAQFPML